MKKPQTWSSLRAEKPQKSEANSTIRLFLYQVSYDLFRTPSKPAPSPIQHGVKLATPAREKHLKKENGNFSMTNLFQRNLMEFSHFSCQLHHSWDLQ